MTTSPIGTATRFRRPRARRSSRSPSASESHCAAILIAAGRLRESLADDFIGILRHSAEKVRRGHLASLAQENIQQLRRALRNGLDFKVIPFATGAERLRQMDELLGNGSAVSLHQVRGGRWQSEWFGNALQRVCVGIA